MLVIVWDYSYIGLQIFQKWFVTCASVSHKRVNVC